MHNYKTNAASFLAQMFGCLHIHPVALDKSACQIHKCKVQHMLVISAGTQAQMMFDVLIA